MNKLFIFIYYLATQPFIELWHLIKSMFEKGATLNYPRTWQHIFLFLTVFAYLAKNRFLTMIFGATLFVTIIKTEWDRGEYMARYRARLEKRAEKELEKKDEVKNE